MDCKGINFNVSDFRARLAQFQQVLDTNPGVSQQEIMEKMRQVQTPTQSATKVK